MTLDTAHLLPPVLFGAAEGWHLAAFVAGRQAADLHLDQMKELSGGGRGTVIMGLDAGRPWAAACVAQTSPPHCCATPVAASPSKTSVARPRQNSGSASAPRHRATARAARPSALSSSGPDGLPRQLKARAECQARRRAHSAERTSAMVPARSCRFHRARRGEHPPPSSPRPGALRRPPGDQPGRTTRHDDAGGRRGKAATSCAGFSALGRARS